MMRRIAILGKYRGAGPATEPGIVAVEEELIEGPALQIASCLDELIDLGGSLPLQASGTLNVVSKHHDATNGT
jgi:hypothetical protein